MTQVWLLNVVHFPGPSDETAPDNTVGSARTLGACLAAGAAEKVRTAARCWMEPGWLNPVEVGRAERHYVPRLPIGSWIKLYLKTGP